MSDLSKFTVSQTSKLRLLCLSNGHGEDIIAIRILQELQQQLPLLELAALPLVGEGRAYADLGIPIIGSVKSMPSGGFIYMDGGQLVRDLRGGLLKLTLAQLQAVRDWMSLQPESRILAVGDIVPLLFAWFSGAKYAFVGTAKSEYYLRDESGWLPRRSLFARFEGWSGSVYHPWERWLMSHPRCQAVFPRDSLTTQILQKWSIPAFDSGNPMMDRLAPVKPLAFANLEQEELLTILLLPGSRAPEAYANWEYIIKAVVGLLKTFSHRQLLFLAAIAPGLSLELLSQVLVNADFYQLPNNSSLISEVNALTFRHENADIVLTQHAYNECLHLAQVAIAMAGTATEQFVGLGKPAITIPGKGPQFTYTFAEAQSRHLGTSVILVQAPNQVADALKSLIDNPQRLQQIAENSFRRMGEPGAARRIATCLVQQFGQN